MGPLKKDQKNAMEEERKVTLPKVMKNATQKKFVLEADLALRKHAVAFPFRLRIDNI